MSEIKKNDFVEIEYTGTVKEDKVIFDTTNEELAKKNDIQSENTAYGPLVICIGQSEVIPGLDNALPGKDINKTYTIDIKPENAFGKRDAKLIQLVPTNKFLKEKIQPMPGLQVSIDGVMAVIKSVSGGRTLVDFNHPLSGKDIIYEVKINKKVTDAKEKLAAFLKLQLNKKDIEITLENNEATVKAKIDIPNEISDILAKKVKELIPEITKITFTK